MVKTQLVYRELVCKCLTRKMIRRSHGDRNYRYGFTAYDNAVFVDFFHYDKRAIFTDEELGLTSYRAYVKGDKHVFY